jgi:hypothetical protein
VLYQAELHPDENDSKTATYAAASGIAILAQFVTIAFNTTATLCLAFDFCSLQSDLRAGLCELRVECDYLFSNRSGSARVFG